MFSPDIVESDAFLDMPISSQALYFHLGMFADDDGFVSPRKIMRMLGVSEDDMKILVTKRFVMPFQSGVVVIKHWRVNNLVRKDWYRETTYLDEKAQLYVKEKGAYTLDPAQGTPLASLPAPSVVNEPLPNRPRRLGKDRLGKEEKDTFGVRSNVFLNKEEHRKLCDTYGRSAIGKLIEEMSTYQAANGKHYKDHYAALLNWAKRKGVVEERTPVALPPAPEKPISKEEQKKIEDRRKEITAKFSRKPRQCSHCTMPATKQTVKGKKNQDAGGLPQNDGWYCDNCYRKGLEIKEEAMYG